MKRAALFVGVNRYEDPEINNLDCAESDATELYAFFKHRAAYDDVRHLLSPDSDDLLDTAHDMAASLDPDDLFLFFFAGHGVEYEGRHLLLCPRARYSRLKYHQHAVPLDLLKQETAKTGIHRVLILDACRSDLLKGERAAVGSGLRDVACLRKTASTNGEAEGSLAILCSCDEGQQAREIPQCRQGIFSVSLLQILTDSLSASQEVALSDALEDTLVARMGDIAAKYGFTIRQRPWIQRSGRPAVLITGTLPLSTPTKPPSGRSPAPHPVSEGLAQADQHQPPADKRLGQEPDSVAEKVLAKAKHLILEGNAREARDRLRRLLGSESGEHVLASVLLGIALLCERQISAMRENDIREAESLLVCGLQSSHVAGLAAYALAAIRHCFYRDHSMKEPSPSFRDLKTLYVRSTGIGDDFRPLADQIKVCEDFGSDWTLA